MPRDLYWKHVAVHLLRLGIAKADGRQLDWATLEVLAESRGFARKNIPNPVDMAQNGLAQCFRHFEI